MKSILNQRTFVIFIWVMLAVALLSGCAPKESVESCLTGHKYGFLGGLWHGLIAPIDFVIMLFRDDVAMYAQNNNGAWYAFGFLLGSGGWGFFGSKGINRNKKRAEK
jgi:hypothetical protein